MTETELRSRRIKLVGFWVVFSLLMFIPVHYKIGGVVTMFAAVGAVFMAGINLFLIISGQKGAFDVSDLSPSAQSQSNYADTDEQPLGTMKRFDDGWEPRKRKGWLKRLLGR